jgi:hypothetical protein
VDNASINEQVSVAGIFSRLISEVEARDLMVPITVAELKSILTLFKRDKSPGPDGWTVEFYIHFFDLIKEDLLALVENVRTGGHIAGSLNSTFIALIPKMNKPHCFGDYRPISLVQFSL